MPIGIEHHLDDCRVSEPAGDLRAKRAAQHPLTARGRLKSVCWKGHGSSPTMRAKAPDRSGMIKDAENGIIQQGFSNVEQERRNTGGSVV
jgi:hypothetical protein